ncbi:MAG: VWA domain-containing protein [Acidobacteria bacterium]|nr:VWA domain-containing protein [Acidobacteriota bacterium]
MKRLFLLLLLLAAVPLFGQDKLQQLAQEKLQQIASATALTINLEPLGDNDAGVVLRATFRYTLPEEIPPEAIALQGSVMQAGVVVKNFRFMLGPDQQKSTRTVFTVPAGETEIEAKLVVAYEDLVTPIIVGKESAKLTVAKTNKPYVATAGDGAEAIVAEGIVPESSGAVKIRPPRRDVAPNLFLIDVDTAPQVKKVEFWVENKKIMTRNAPPYHAELDLGKIPKRVEVRAVGYDEKGRYVDADAFVVNERETPLEVKITRTVTPDQVSHFKLSVQNPKNTEIKTVILYAGKNKIYEWSHPPYAVDLPNARLANVDFVRAAVTDETAYEAGDLLFLNGDRYTEEIDVNLVELPVSVTDAAGLPIAGLTEKNFTVLENGKPQKLASFNYASNLPISVGVLIDHSGSMVKRMDATKEAAIEFFRTILKGKDRAFIGGFAFDASKLAPFVGDISVLQAQVDAIPKAEGGTSLYDAIVTGLYRFRNVQGRKALIVLTDGEDTTSRLPYDEMLSYVRASRVPLYFIGIGLGFGDMSGTSKMKALAAETGGVAYFIKDVKQLKDTYSTLEKDLRSQYLLAYNTESTKKDTAYRSVEVKVDQATAKVRTIRGFIP